MKTQHIFSIMVIILVCCTVLPVFCIKHITHKNTDKIFKFLKVFHACIFFASWNKNSHINHLSLLVNFASNFLINKNNTLPWNRLSADRKLFSTIFKPKYRTLCIVGLAESVKTEKLNGTNSNLIRGDDKNYGTSYQQDYIIIILQTYKLLKIRVPISKYSRSTLVIIHFPHDKIYVECFTCLPWFDGLAIIIRMDDKLDKLSTYSTLKDLVFTTNFPIFSSRRNRWDADQDFPVETMGSRIKVTSLCYTSLVGLSINCSLYFCMTYKKEFADELAVLDFYVAHGVERYGMKYSIFYTSGRKSNIFALLSPFSLPGWLVLGIIFGMTSTVLWLTSVSFNPLYWMLSTVIEQHDDRSSEKNKFNWHVILSWLYFGFVLRTAYTSNLYDYMAWSTDTNKFPTSFYDLLLNYSTIVFGTNDATYEYSNFLQSVVNCEDSLKKTTICNVAKAFLSKWWRLSPFNKAHEYVKQNESGLEVCKNINDGCKETDRFTYAYTTGPTDAPTTMFGYVDKILLLTGMKLKLFANNAEGYIYQNGHTWLVSDNIWRQKSELAIAVIYESGIATLPRTYSQYSIAKNYIENWISNGTHVTVNGKAVRNNIILSSVRTWLRLGCFQYFRQDGCIVATEMEETKEISVSLCVLKVVWVLYGTLQISSTLLFVNEIRIKVHRK